MEAGSIVWALKHLRGYLWGTKVRTFFDHRVLGSIGKVGGHNTRVKRWLEFLTAFDYTLEYRKGSANGNANFLSRLPEPATVHDRNGSTSLTPAEDGGIYLIGACGLHTPSSPILGVCLGGLMPGTKNNALGGLPFAPADFCDFRAHEPRMKLNDLLTPLRGFVTRGSASIATVDRSPGRGWILRATNNDFSLVIVVPTAVSEGSAEAPATTTSFAQPTPSRSSVHGTDSVKPTGPTASVSTSPGSPAPQTMAQSTDRVSTRIHQRKKQQLVGHPMLSTMDSGPTGSLGHLPDELQPRREFPGPAISARRRDPWSCRLTGPHGATSVLPRPCRAYGNSSLTRLRLATRRLHLQGRTPSATLLNCGSLIPSCVVRMPIGSERSTLSRRATRQCVTSLSTGHQPCAQFLAVLPLAQASLPIRHPRAGG